MMNHTQVLWSWASYLFCLRPVRQYWRTALERMEKLQIMQALWGLYPPRHSDISQSQESLLPTSAPLFSNNKIKNTQLTSTDFCFLFPVLLGLLQKCPTQQQAHSAIGQDTLIHGKTVFVIPTIDLDHTTHPGFSQSISSYSCGHSGESTNLCSQSLLMSF